MYSLTDKMEKFAKSKGVRWNIPESDLSLNTCGWWEDADGNIIGQDDHLVEWIKAKQPPEVE